MRASVFRLVIGFASDRKDDGGILNVRTRSGKRAATDVLFEYYRPRVRFPRMKSNGIPEQLSTLMAAVNFNDNSMSAVQRGLDISANSSHPFAVHNGLKLCAGSVPPVTRDGEGRVHKWPMVEALTYDMSLPDPQIVV